MSRILFKEFRWADESIEDWQEIWSFLWRLNLGWAWQRGDYYARPLANGDLGMRWTVFTAVEKNWIFGDLDGVAPLPSISSIREILRWADNHMISVFADSSEEEMTSRVIVLLEQWLGNYGTVTHSAPKL
jgi:hypothetical protein